MLLHATYVSEFIGCTSSKILVGKRSEWAVSFFNSIEYKFIVSCNMHISFGRLNDAFQMEIPSGFKAWQLLGRAYGHLLWFRIRAHAIQMATENNGRRDQLCWVA